MPDPSRHRRTRTADRLLGALCWASALAVVAVFLWLLWDLLSQGLSHLSWSFLTGTVEDAGRGGGIAPVILSTLLILLVCLAVAVPLGVGCATWLSEYQRPDGALAGAITKAVDLLASVPSIVFGLFGMVFFCQVLDLGFSITAGGLTLACMILPIIIRTTLTGLHSAPNELRLGAAALGMTRHSALRHLLIPAAVPGIVVGVTLGISRAMAETAALIFTSGYATRMPSSLSDSGRAMSVHIYDLAMNVPGGAANAAASAAILLAVLTAINFTASKLSDRWHAKAVVTR